MPLTTNTVLVCAGGACISAGEKSVKQVLEDEIKKYGLDEVVRIVETGCMGSCTLGPIVVVYPEGVFYKKVTPESAKKIVEEHLLKGRIVEELLYQGPTGEVLPKVQEELPFFKKQVKIVTRNLGVIDPTKIEEYIARDGYFALARVLKEMKPEDVIDEIKRSGLRGRGGAGFPTGLKWEFTAKASGDQKYVLCNADEGEPGTFKDRLIMEGDPHSLIEGMIIAGYAVGATKGYIYIRGEYYGSIDIIRKAIEDAYEYGFLGKDILGSGFSFDLSVRLGAGAYVAGEETALIESIEGKPAKPRLKPPYPPTFGLFGKPTVVNNVETFVNVPRIILKGADWFKSFGTESSPGTKVFSLVGNVVKKGIVEVPLGTTVRDLIFKFGGGVEGGKKLKIVQTGGTAGTFIGPDKLDVPLDYDSYQNHGVSLGSGVILVADETHCAVDLALNAMKFYEHESCGKCTPCREGTKLAVQILERISKGQGRKEDLDLLREIAKAAGETSFCGLGQSIPVPLLSILENFKEEFEAHIGAEGCPVGVCKFEKPKKKKMYSFRRF
ncbi:MAG: NADH-quinone oxidoreductase subunit NuoF [Thermotogae bacterium]|nr:MAG: NADH-quinone oxidoreductase subunit NuoF [Thermotogota bacterium]